MKSKTSFFNGPVFRKNMTRFAPVWLLYTLCLILGMAMMYISDGRVFWFASRMGEMNKYLALVNLFYAPLVAMLLFGDLYNSRMCNALHAMPLKRECWFMTNVLSGLVFSLLPTAIMCGLSVPLLMNTCVVDAQWIALWAFLGMNLSYICFFGLAVFSVFCVGNRFGMAAVYALLNGGAFVVYFLVDTIYTPMLYGVVTPTVLVENLTPIANLIENTCVDLDPYLDLVDIYNNRLEDMVANFWLVREGWITVMIWAAVGVAFMSAGLLLYRKRKLECAGDTIAVRGLEPVFMVCFAVCTAALAGLFFELFFGTYYRENLQMVLLACGLMVGWFAGRMLIERSVRVFRVKNWLGLAALAAVLAVSLGLTYFDVFGISDWTPEVEDVKSVTFGYSSYRGMSEELTEDADIEAVIRLQELALEDRMEVSGQYPVINGETAAKELIKTMDHETLEATQFRYATDILIYYEMENGRTVSRHYIIWADGEEGGIINEYLSRWEVVRSYSFQNSEEVTVVVGDIAAEGPVERISVWGEAVPEEYCTQEDLDALLAAIQADCEERTMTQRAAFHNGRFASVDEEGITRYDSCIWVDFYTTNGSSGDFYVFPDSENTLNWLRERGLLKFEVLPDNGYLG